MSTSNEGDTIGVTLKDVKELTNPGGPLKDQQFVAATNIDTWQSGPADAKLTNGDCKLISIYRRYAHGMMIISSDSFPNRH